MTSEIFTLALQDLESLIAKSNCSCHIINPNKTRIILWKGRSPDSELSSKEIKEDGSETYYLRIGIQKFISYPLKDKNKALYWRFNCFEAKAEESTINPNPNNPVTKYQQRLAKTAAINHANSNSTTDNSEQSESVSH